MKRGKGLLSGMSTSNATKLKSGATRTFLSGSLHAKRIVVPATEVESKTAIHALNPRNQEALSLEAVRDILTSISEEGVNVEGTAIACPETGRYLLLDASRRRFCCIEGKADLPLWVLQGDVSDTQILSLINASQEVKRWSYPEHAAYLLKIAENKQLDVDNMKIEELADELAMGRESLRKRLEALGVAKSIRTVFVDFEGIPNSYYGKLAKLERQLRKGGKDVEAEIDRFSLTLKDRDLGCDVADIQKATLDELSLYVKRSMNGRSVKPEWHKENLAEFTDKKAYARSSKSPDGKTMKYDLSRVGADKIKKIDAFIREVLAEG